MGRTAHAVARREMVGCTNQGERSCICLPRPLSALKFFSLSLFSSESLEPKSPSKVTVCLLTGQHIGETL